jgi:hypothetical protein
MCHGKRDLAEDLARDGVVVLDGLLTLVRTQAKRVVGDAKARRCVPLGDAGRAGVARASSVTERIPSNPQRCS